MRRLAPLVAAALSVCGLSATAGPLDADSVGPPAILTAIPDRAFSGFYGALSFGNIDGTLEVPPLSSEFGAGQAFGIVGGYNWQRGGLVYGGEVQVLQSTGTDWSAGAGIEAYDTLFDLRGRAGFASRDVLVYGTLGVSWGVATPSAASSTDTDGLTFGIGLEVNVTDRVFLGADLSHRDLSGNAGAESDVDTLTLRGGLRF